MSAESAGQGEILAVSARSAHNAIICEIPYMPRDDAEHELPEIIIVQSDNFYRKIAGKFEQSLLIHRCIASRLLFLP